MTSAVFGCQRTIHCSPGRVDRRGDTSPLLTQHVFNAGEVRRDRTQDTERCDKAGFGKPRLAPNQDANLGAASHDAPVNSCSSHPFPKDVSKVGKDEAANTNEWPHQFLETPTKSRSLASLREGKSWEVKNTHSSQRSLSGDPSSLACRWLCRGVFHLVGVLDEQHGLPDVVVGKHAVPSGHCRSS